ncbi:GTPase domain-containing protein [Mycolicibacterium sp. PAM1]|uniref:G domain-containing protein n=1 Tax=Mycolicibacterium gilvum (strain PYR-GCK) TaxID=350054 RepID=A4TAU0_MYCGI|nr:GTPase domain-containing protein [Mycolicibacterium sp. PAM1]ABP45669.1 conserved hypothetical protein [Mycolicibacterium gilvum PYR-GCK]MBV5247039.1 GTPase domain-containing protein [Mycolicibacterium sp. PAM1]
MSDPIDVDAAKKWLDAVPGGEIGKRLDRSWQDFAAFSDPVVTIYGSYDTGKSSLLRRLLIELGQEVPTWLTISARHETFEVNEIRAAGCVLRDTPGFVSDGTDARAKMNTGRASDAIALTDVGIVVVPPQLATAEYPVLRELVQQDWVPESLWFVISRFDEAGIDPDDDPDGYRALGEHKERELRAALSLDGSVPVYVVCQDFAQMAGTERNPDPTVWDESRSWDGISELLAAISALGSAWWPGIRQAAAQRFWRSSVQQVLQQLRKELTAHLENAAVSDEGGQRRASWLAQLDMLTRASEADLRGRVSAAVSDAVDSPDPAQSFAQALKTSLGAWHAACERDIDKLLRSVGDAVATERTRPDWQRFEEMAATLRHEPPGPDAILDDELTYAPVVRQVGDAVLNALRHYEQTRGLKATSPTPSGVGVTPSVDRMAAASAGIASREVVDFGSGVVHALRSTSHVER